jgi:hypothetical protein
LDGVFHGLGLDVAMYSDWQARVFLEKLVLEYIDSADPERDSLIKTIRDSSRQVPIRGILENIGERECSDFSPADLEVISELLQAYG